MGSTQSSSVDETPGADAPRIKYGSALEPHHAVHTVYPCTAILYEDENLRVLPPRAIGERYSPVHPVVPDDAVQGNFPWISEDDTHITTLYRTDSNSMVTKKKLDLADSSSSGDLVNDMSRCLPHPGKTELRVVTYTTAGSSRSPQVRIGRFTTIFHPGGKITELPPSIYDSSVLDWRSLSGKPGYQWQSNLLRLIFQSGDRDVRHTDFMLRQTSSLTHTAFYPAYRWKLRMGPPIAETVPRLAPARTNTQFRQLVQLLPSDYRPSECPSCCETLEEAEWVFFLPCTPLHCMCGDCMDRWCEEVGPHKAGCPYCRRQIATPALAAELKAQWKPNYLDMDAVFHFDKRYSNIENHERYWADADRALAASNEAFIVVDADILTDAWSLVRVAVDGDGRSYMLPANAPETFFFQEALFKTAEDYDGELMQDKDLFNGLHKAALCRLRDIYISKGMQTFTDDKTLQKLKDNEDLVPLRNGYRKYIDKTLNRIVQFHVVRACREYHDPTSHFLHSASNPKGYHCHGHRQFWIPREIASIVRNRNGV